jgi:hypothetical protein
MKNSFSKAQTAAHGFNENEPKNNCYNNSGSNRRSRRGSICNNFCTTTACTATWATSYHSDGPASGADITSNDSGSTFHANRDAATNYHTRPTWGHDWGRLHVCESSDGDVV